MEFTQEIKIPQERISILIGTKGEIKRKIQKELIVKIIIDSDSGLITISGEDSLKVYTARSIINAIGRGFNPELAFNLLDDEYFLEIIDITKYSKKSKSRLFELRSRMIGSKGKARITIENLCDVEIRVYGKTVAIIGKLEPVDMAKRAVEKLLSGSEHGKVYSYLEREIKK